MTNNELYDSFCVEFPLEPLDAMSLEKYTNLNKKDSFCYWLEVITSDLGSIWGGSSYKFGIYKYNVSPKRNDKNYIHDDVLLVSILFPPDQYPNIVVGEYDLSVLYKEDFG